MERRPLIKPLAVALVVLGWELSAAAQVLPTCPNGRPSAFIAAITTRKATARLPPAHPAANPGRLPPHRPAAAPPRHRQDPLLRPLPEPEKVAESLRRMWSQVPAPGGLRAKAVRLPSRHVYGGLPGGAGCRARDKGAGTLKPVLLVGSTFAQHNINKSTDAYCDIESALPALDPLIQCPPARTPALLQGCLSAMAPAYR